MEDNLVMYDCTVGSRAYNLVTPTSDYDHRRIVTPTDLSYFFGLKSFNVGNVITTHEEDNTDYSVKRLIELIMKCNTVMLEMMFAPEDCQTYVHPLFKKYFLDNRHKFLSLNLYDSIVSYARGEYKRSTGELRRKLGGKRKDDIEKLGFSPRNASHCIRLLLSADRALRTGEYPVRWETGTWQQKYLYDLKCGNIPFKDYEWAYTDSLEGLADALLKSTLPATVDADELNNMLVNFYKEMFNIK